jgi:hypothetical protein
MGFESFQVWLRTPQKNPADIEALLLSLPEISIDHETYRWSDSRYFLWNDGQHIVEIELDIDPVQLSTRFMLCNPETVTQAYAKFLMCLLHKIGGKLEFVGPGPSAPLRAFTCENLSDFPEVLRASIAPQRAGWVAMCGPRVMPANSRIAFEEFILPLCTPVSAPLTTNH